MYRVAITWIPDSEEDRPAYKVSFSDETLPMAMLAAINADNSLRIDMLLAVMLISMYGDDEGAMRDLEEFETQFLGHTELVETLVRAAHALADGWAEFDKQFEKDDGSDLDFSQN